MKVNHKLALTAALLASAFAATAVAVPAPGAATARARAVIRDMGTGAALGTILVTEVMAPSETYVDHRIDVTGTVTVPLAQFPTGEYGLHLWEGSCDDLYDHLDFTFTGHPAHSGDLPNVIVTDIGGGNGRMNIRFTKITNRFGISSMSDDLNPWSWVGGDVSLVIDDSPADEFGSGTPVLCGELICTNDGNCVDFGRGNPA